MKELYNIILSSLYHRDGSTIKDINIRYIRCVQNIINYHQYAERFKVSFKKNCDYKVYCQGLPVLYYIIDQNYYEDFKIVLKYFENYYESDYKDQFFIDLCNIFTYASESRKTLFIIYLLKNYKYKIIISIFLGVCIHHNINNIKMMSKVFKYIQTSPYYTETIFNYELIYDVFDMLCYNNHYKLVHLLLSLRTSNGDGIVVKMSHIKEAEDEGYKDLVIVLCNAWIRQKKDQEIIVTDILNKYS